MQGVPALGHDGDYTITCRSTAMTFTEDVPFKFAPIDIVDEHGHSLDNPRNMQRESGDKHLPLNSQLPNTERKFTFSVVCDWRLFSS